MGDHTYKTDCKHEWIWSEPKETTGENLLGKEVTAWGGEAVCKLCATTTWKRIEKEKI